MKWVALSIFVSSLVISFHYVWINRFEMKTQTINKVPSVLIINKWTGSHCLTTGSEVEQVFKSLGYKICKNSKAGKITFP